MSAERSFVLDRTINASLESAQKPKVSDYFADLPVAPNTNLEILAPLLNQDTNVDYREHIINRYLDIYNIRKANGIYGQPEINLEMAIALVDNDTFSGICEAINRQGEVIEVATHELGHGAVASALGWHVESMTVVPASNYLGLTVTSPGGEKSLSDWAIESAAISFGGAIAAKMAGHEVKGHGSDMASASAKARIAMQDPNCPFSSEGALLTHAQNLAHSALSRSGSARIHKMALDLACRKTIV